MRYFLTTAIDYVNSRPHLGTAYEKITADVIARYHRLAGDDTWFLMGNDEHSQNVFRKARRAGQGSAGLLRRDGAGLPRRLEAPRRLVRRLHPHHRPPAALSRRCRSWPRRCLDHGDIYEGAYEGFYCVGCEAFKPEKDLVDGLCPIHQTKPDWIREKNWFFRLSKYQQPLLEHYRAASGLHRAGDPAQRDPAAGRGRPRGHLDEPGRAVVGHSAALRPASVVYVWFDALINYAAAVGYGWNDELLRAVVAGQPPRRRQGHHPLPLRDLAGDADEREAAAAGAGVRARLGLLQGRADEQVAGQHRRSARRRGALRSRSAAAVPGQGSAVRRRRRLHVGALRGEVQRRPGEQPRQPGEPRHGDDRAVPAGA